MTLTTKYLGLTLAHPIMCGASPLTADLNLVLRLEDAGSAAIVMHSLFEEQIVKGAMRRTRQLRDARPQPPAEELRSVAPYSRLADEYLEHLLRVKSRVRVPVFASLNGTTPEGWLQFARAMEQAGADGLELNFYNIATDPVESGNAIEQRLIDIVAVLTESIAIPIAVKLLPFYSSVPHLAARLERIGADGLVLFNSTYLPDIDPETGRLVTTVHLSNSSDLIPRLHAVANVARFSSLSLAVSGGVHDGVDVVKAVMAGADAVQVTSALLRDGPARMTHLRDAVESWFERQGYQSVAQLKNAAAIAREYRPPCADRSEYRAMLASWNSDRHLSS